MQPATSPTFQPGTWMDPYLATSSELYGPLDHVHVASMLPDARGIKSVPHNRLEDVLSFLQQSSLPEGGKLHAHLVPLNDRRFDELCIDVYYELVCRDPKARQEGGREILTPGDLLPERVQARNKLSSLDADLFDDLASGVFSEIRRRYPFLGHHKEIGDPALHQFRTSRSEYSDDSLLTLGAVTDSDPDLDSENPSVPSTGSEDEPWVEVPAPSSLLRAPTPPEPEIYHSFVPYILEENPGEEPELENAMSVSPGSGSRLSQGQVIPPSSPVAPSASIWISHKPEVPSMTPPPHPLEPFSKSSTLCLDGQIISRSKHVVASGGYADVWTGSLHDDTVAIKTMRAFSSMGTPIQKAKLLKRLWREFLTWSCISHPNILECLGFSYDFSPEYGYQVPALISPWMGNGTVLSYIERNPDADRLNITVGVAKGLSYLHNREPAIVHGDLRAGNILVSNAGIPCLTDFGLSRILSDTQGMSTSSSAAGSLRWMSPELLHDDKASESSDVWAYGMTVLEIISGMRPYHEFNLEPVVLRHIIDGRVPSRPPQHSSHVALTDELWEICRRCWAPQPAHRSSMREVTLELMAELHQQRSRDWGTSQSPTSGSTPRSSSPPLSARSSWTQHRKAVNKRASSSQWQF